MFKISGIYPGHFPALPATFLQLCVVAAFTHFLTSYQRAKVAIIF
jgi:hypothetical protein